MKANLGIIIVLIFITSTGLSQSNKTDQIKISGPFYKISLATTLKINEDWTVETDDDETFLEPSALFINNTIGYQFDRRSLISLNFEYDWHSEQGLQFFPAYLGFQYNIIHFESGFNEYIYQSNVFIRGGYGTFLSLGKSFEKGNMYKFGLGFQGQVDDSNNSILIGLDYTRKRFGYRTLEGLSSISIFIEFMVF